ncbi:DNA-processing protein DprA [Candidatus Poriferisodalis sp.]|uniref:DNA-processing protein DprA n=1 Tax=Candidatus Poriferisodalis sp. TaxID=3101277 RepID=UPI003B016A98
MKASEYWELTAILEAGPSGLLGRSAADLAIDSGISNSLADRVAALVDRATALAFELERLEHSGVQTLTPFDEHYPKSWTERLGPKAPPLLYAAGPAELLDTAGLGVVGSRDVSPSGAEVAAEAAKCASRHSIPLVSGGARGVDQLAMNSAFNLGGTVVGLLADSLSRKLAKSDVRAAIHSGLALMCTPYNPDAGFSAGNAMGRNKLIYALSTLTLVVASDEGKGGTWTGATEALDHKFGRVAVWRGSGEGPGNEALERRGALPISDLDDLERLLDDGDADTTPNTSPLTSETEQGVLFSIATAD